MGEKGRRMKQGKIQLQAVISVFLGTMTLAVWGQGWAENNSPHAGRSPLASPGSQRQEFRKQNTAWEPIPLSAEHRRWMYETEEDTLTKPVCTGGRRVTLKCRDKEHYVTTNEFHHELYDPYLRGLGGAYAGVGTDQNFTLIAWSRSRIAFLMDYDPVVVSINYAHRAFILAATTRQKYLYFWKPQNKQKGAALLRRVYHNHPEKEAIVDAYLFARKPINFHYHILQKRRFGWNYHRMKPDPTRRNLRDKRDYNWIHQESDYLYIRKMFQQDRIRVMKGDLLLDKSLRGIGTICRKMNMPFRVLYMSNAEEFWKYPPSFRQNILNLPMDQHSVIVRTRFTSKYGPRLDAWIYILQQGPHFQTMLKDPKHEKVDAMMVNYKNIVRGLFTIHVPTPKGAMRHLKTP